MNLYPAVLSESVQEAQAEIMYSASFPKIRTIQIDVIDGQFADETTISPSDAASIDFGELSCDFHLMVEEPLDCVYEIIEHKAYLPMRAVLAQVERMSHQRDVLQLIKKYNWQAGLSLDLYTPLEEIEEESWHYLDSVQLMAIEAGAQGKSFNPLVFEKIKELRREIARRHRSIEILIDGGIKHEHVPALTDAGVDSIVVGSGLWAAQDLAHAVKNYLE